MIYYLIKILKYKIGIKIRLITVKNKNNLCYKNWISSIYKNRNNSKNNYTFKIYIFMLSHFYLIKLLFL